MNFPPAGILLLECTLPGKNCDFSGQTRLLALITPCSKSGGDASQEILCYKEMRHSLILDLQSVVAVVGRLKRGDRWYIVDRTGGLIKPEFVPPVAEWDGQEVEAVENV
ncbi:hypothetical protein GGX14DRAFT_367909 [Mycena pura]|uniref:Uncharacterized protein n=1 Tax=Mycena pura TaxID=153505 RepID=A0AAD6YCB7_9AGAR|nr:hypothetical protein GGX14DRAFT_367909 [Mycena pura]